MTTGFVSAEEYFWHDTGSGWVLPADTAALQPFQHPENPETKRRLLNLLRRSGLLDELTLIEPRRATVEDVALVHRRPYIDSIAEMSRDSGGNAGGFTPFGHGSYETALLSAGGALAAVDAVLDGTVDNAYVLNRPPGHHSLPDTGMGFCIFNNASIAVRHLRRRRGVGRVAMVDWDVHHGNGQQAVFYSDPDVLTLSVHQNLCFPPNSGYITDRGEGAGNGYNLNVPLPPGSGHGAFLEVFDRVVIPALHRFGPEFVVVPSGFDGGIFDPLGRQLAYSETYRALTAELLTAAAELCGGRIVMTHEGGYSAPYVPFLGMAVLEEMSAIRTGTEDPFLPIVAGTGGHDLERHQDEVISAAAALVDDL
ncbi:class II histone deacetylase [Candidatus Poriferisodalis sp.]|uniref:class II histone deacetylase n=1 Tax=Candidatus Poriferisodalis sp. TaxID=3101277 RepID=UPI003B5AC60E